jgi:hypothetical protein
LIYVSSILEGAGIKETFLISKIDNGFTLR